MAVQAVGGPAAWRGAELAGSAEWILPFAAEHLAELAEHDGCGPALSDLGRAVRAELEHGRGFVVLRGLPVHDDLDEIERRYARLGDHIGIAVAQDGAGATLVHVRDQGLDYLDPHVRGYQTRAALDYHVDGSDVVGLLCVRAARRGGASTIVSAVAIHDEMLARSPELVEVLYEPVWFDRRNGDGPESFYQAPVFRRDDERVTIYYGRSYIESAQRGPHGEQLTDRQLAAFDLLDELAHSLALAMDLQPGDVQLLDNRVVLHARTAYEDWPEAKRKRDMVRLWLSLGHGEDAVMISGGRR